MSKPEFDQAILSIPDQLLLSQFLRGFRQPDLVIAADGTGPYLFRWFVVPRNPKANVYLHVQVADDPDRELHDHPWDNSSVILANGYEETILKSPEFQSEFQAERRRLGPGDVVFRRAKEAHRLFLPPASPYSISLFTTGPLVREWGFWSDGKWYNFKNCVEIVDGVSRNKLGGPLG